MTDTHEAEKKAKYFAYHSSAAGLILCAAQQSGLLESVAKMLLAGDKWREEGIRPQLPMHGSDCVACELLQELTDAFDEPTCLPGSVWEDLFGGDAGVPEYSKEELEPYMSKPAFSEIPA
jgi:hypothetical protein